MSANNFAQKFSGVTCKLLLFSVIFANILPVHGGDIRPTNGSGGEHQTRAPGGRAVASAEPIEGKVAEAGPASARSSPQQVAGIQSRNSSDDSVMRSLRETRRKEHFQSSDPCEEYAFSSFRPSVLVKCIDKIKFAYARDVGNLNSVIKTLATFYPFRHIAMASPNPRLPGKYDVVAALVKLRQSWAKYQGRPARKFHEKIYSLVTPLNDGHTMYSSRCFLPGVYSLPLSLVSHVEKGAVVISVAPVHMLQNTSVSSSGFDGAMYAEARVLRIDGQRAQRYLLNMAATVGFSRDLGTRYNSLFASLQMKPRRGFFSFSLELVASPGLFAQRTLPPASDFLTLTLIRKGSTAAVTVRVPWGASFTSFSSYTISSNLKAQCTTSQCYSSSSKGQAKRFVPMNMRAFRPDQDWEPEERKGAMGAREPARSAPASGFQLGSTPVLPGAQRLTTAQSFLQTFLLPDKTVVVTIPLFGESVFKELFTAAYWATSKGKRVVLDMRGNGGGEVEACWSMVRLITGADKVPRRRWASPLEAYHGNDVVSAMVNRGSGVYNNRFWANVAQQSFTETRETFFFPLRRQRWVRSQPFAQYSQSFKIPNSYSEFPPYERLFGTLPLLILTDGQCYSSCALFVNTLKVTHGIKVVTAGGLPGVPMPTSNTCGGVSLSSAQFGLLCEISSEVLKQPVAPAPFLNGSDLSLAWASTRIPASNPIPCEFDFYAPSHRLNYTLATATNPAALWAAAARFF